MSRKKELWKLVFFSNFDFCVEKKSFCAERFEIVLNGYFFVLKRQKKDFYITRIAKTAKVFLFQESFFRQKSILISQENAMRNFILITQLLQKTDDKKMENENDEKKFLTNLLNICCTKMYERKL
ncbi:hypothetical protein BpHYR1_031395 [Brachionus plicatilis]|uniref:Uncharacterized protein n=1 Tax=Brachionus plicatilis TaxID=10195 RepID=A0A3M7RW88_BRAPC|nr:hypothetical protein BpHYR1_031395 [Brachionus plicatilis]